MKTALASAGIMGLLLIICTTYTLYVEMRQISGPMWGALLFIWAVVSYGHFRLVRRQSGGH